MTAQGRIGDQGHIIAAFVELIDEYATDQGLATAHPAREEQRTVFLGGHVEHADQCLFVLSTVVEKLVIGGVVKGLLFE